MLKLIFVVKKKRRRKNNIYFNESGLVTFNNV